MSFIIDKQTLNDLTIFGKGRGNSVYNLFNKTRTRGGALILEDMFRYPLDDMEKINQRSSIIKFFMDNNIEFEYQNEWFDSIEHYLSNTDARTKLSMEDDTLQRKFKGAVGSDTEYQLLHKGAISAISIVNATADLLKKIGRDNPYQEEFDRLSEILNDEALAWVKDEKDVKKLSYAKMVAYDKILRFELNEKLKKLLYHVYNIDAFISIGQVAKENNFVFGKALPMGSSHMILDGIFHPLLKGAVPNTIHIDSDNNIIFLTGANMAGKSTFMKTFGITIFLAHMGFPLPAKHVEFAVQQGMFTTINLPDNLNMGYSHFYAEVLRVKKVAEQVSHTENLVIIFDELFRGTNVKDAHEATVAVTEALSEKKKCTFIISTHIIEAGDDLKKLCNNINYIYLPTVMNGSMPSYPYTLEQGITNDRHGMMIINNERIIERLKENTLKKKGGQQ